MISKLAHRYCYEVENIENYEQAMADPLEIWDCHHRYEIYNGRTISRSTLKNRGLLYNRPASELIFLRHEDHISLHNKGEKHPMYGKHVSEGTSIKISESLKGKYKGEKNPMYGKHHSDEIKDKISESLKGKYKGEKNPMYGKHPSKETCKKMSENHANIKGKNNPMYGKHHNEESRRIIGESKKGTHRVYHEDGTYHYEKTTN